MGCFSNTINLRHICREKITLMFKKITKIYCFYSWTVKNEFSLLSLDANNVTLAGQNASTLDVHLRPDDPPQTPSSAKNLTYRCFWQQVCITKQLL